MIAGVALVAMVLETAIVLFIMPEPSERRDSETIRVELDSAPRPTVPE